MFVPYGRIYSFDRVRGIARRCELHRRQALVAVRAPRSGTASRVRDRVRPDFHVFTGNDLAIDMVCYGSDYLLGLSAFAPEAFAERDRRWASGDRSFHELNDLLQYLGAFAFRAPVPAYRHDAALFLQLRGRIASDATPPGAPRRAESRPRRARRHRRAAGRAAVTADAIVQVKRLRTIDELRDRLSHLGIGDQLGVDDDGRPDGPLATAFSFTDGSAGTSTGGQPVRGPAHGGLGRRPPTVGRPTSCTAAGGASARAAPSSSGAAKRSPCGPTARANPRQLVLDATTVGDLAALRAELVDAHVGAHGNADGSRRRPAAHALRPLVAADRRVAAPARVPPPRARPACRHRRGRRAVRRRPRRARRRRTSTPRCWPPTPASTSSTSSTATATCCTSCSARSIATARTADRSSTAPRSCVGSSSGIRARVPRLAIGVRLSAYDVVPYEAGADGVGVPVADAAEVARATTFGLADSHRFLDLCRELGIGLVCITAGSPYYNPHVQRPAFFPPSDGYTPPEDPLVGAARMIAACAELARAHPDLALVGSGLLVPPAVAPPRRAAHDPHRRRGFRRHRPRDAQLPRAPGRRPRRSRTRHARGCAARSATAPPRRATASCRAASRSTTSTRTAPSAIELAAIKKATRKRTRR